MMDEEIILSIIIPVYNVENSVEKCLQSIIMGLSNEELSQIELVVVDDKSQDNSLEIVEAFQKQNECNIRVINHENNLGLGGARNSGINNSVGKFVTFIDSDDYYYPDSIAYLLKKIQGLDNDAILIFGFNATKDNITKWSYKPNDEQTLASNEALWMFACDEFSSSVWNKVFPNEPLKSNLFKTHIYYEDLEFLPRMISAIDSVKFVPQTLVNYRQDNSSITRQLTKIKHIDDLFFAVDSLHQSLKSHEIFSTIFCDRWAYLLKIWDLNSDLVEYAFNKLYKGIIDYDIFFPNRRLEKLRDSVRNRIDQTEVNTNISNLYEKILDKLEPQNPFFSIITPMYNADKFIEKAVLNYSKQSFKNFELIFVDDHSTDNSMTFVEEFQQKFDFIRVFQLPSNQGAGKARNLGIQKAKGHYIIFNDADDWFDNNGLELIYNHLQVKEYPDLVIFPFSVYDSNMKLLWSQTKIENLEDKTYTGEQIFKEIVQSNINPSPWNKVFRKDTWIDNHITFPEQIHHQDLSAIPYACFKSKRVTVLKEKLYNYVTNNAGVTKTVSDKHVYSPFKAIDGLFDFFKKDEIFDIWVNHLYQIAFETFRYNFNIRKDKFSNDQIKTYIIHFNDFCSSHEIQPHFLLSSASSFDFISDVYSERTKRGLSGMEIIPVTTDKSYFYKLFENYQLLITQHKLATNNVSSINNYEVPLPGGSTKKLMDRLDELEKDKLWYRNTYEHLPKWYVKIGGVFRRIRF